jgi:hypothetical protein
MCKTRRKSSHVGKSRPLTVYPYPGKRAVFKYIVRLSASICGESRTILKIIVIIRFPLLSYCSQTSE